MIANNGLINSLLSRDISITSPKIDFLPEEFAGELDLIDPILPGIDEDDFDEEEGEIDNDILQIEDEILREKLLNVNLLIDKIEALNLTPSIPFVLEYPSSSPIPVVDSDFLIEEVDTFLVPEDSIPPGIESDFDSEGDIIFSNDLLNDDPIPEYERFTFDIEPDAPVINNFDELNEDECFDPGGGEIDVSQNIKDDNSFAFVIRNFLPYLTYLWSLLYFSPLGVKTPFLTPASPLRAGGISSGWNFHNIRVNSFTMKMEILLEPTSNKLMVEHAEYDESNTYVLERFNTTAGNPVKKILLKLNLSDHRLFKMVVEVPDSSWLTRSIATCSYPTDKHKDIMKAQVRIYQKSQENRQKRANTDTGNGRAQKKPGNQAKVKKSTLVNSQECHVDVKKAQEKRDFTLLSLTEQTQTSQSRIATLAIRVRSFSDLTAQDDSPIIEKLYGHD
ncbi:hypothetical protein Tco_0071838 [Tanacetum coccineum]